MNRTYQKYIIVLGAFITQLCLGSLYTWSVFQNSLVETYGWSKFSSQIPFTIAVFTNPLFMISAGQWQDRAKPSKIAFIGGLLLGIGYILAGFIDIISKGNEIMGVLWLSLTYGLIAGAGIGFAYVVPVATLIKWFPQKKGLIVGLAVFGFGIGSLFFLQIEDLLININPSKQIGTAFLIMGVLFLCLVAVVSNVFTNPPPEIAEYECIDQSSKPCVQVKPNEMLRRSEFWLLWLSFIITASAGIMTIGNIKSCVQNQLVIELTPKEISFIGTTMGGIFAIFNGLGRITWGGVSDKIGRTVTMVLMFTLLCVSMVLFPFQIELLFITITACMIGFAYGGNFSLFPAITADYFGTENLGSNYSLLFTALSVAGILGPFLAGIFPYTIAFPLLGVSVLISITLIIVTESLHKKNSLEAIDIDN